MRCFDTLEIDLPVPDEIAFRRTVDWYDCSDEMRLMRDDDDRSRRSVLRRRMLRVARESCPSTRDRARRGPRQRNPFKETAYHESGHVIAAAALCIPVRRAMVLGHEQAIAQLNPSQRGFWLRSSEFGSAEILRDVSDYQHAVADAFVLAAGPAAEIIGGGAASDFNLNFDGPRDSDAFLMFESCRWAFTHHYGTADRLSRDVADLARMHDEIWSLACRFAADHRAIQAIEAVAAHLRDYGSIRGAEIVHIADRHGVKGIPEIASLRALRPRRLADVA